MISSISLRLKRMLTFNIIITQLTQIICLTSELGNWSNFSTWRRSPFARSDHIFPSALQKYRSSPIFLKLGQYVHNCVLKSFLTDKSVSAYLQGDIWRWKWRSTSQLNNFCDFPPISSIWKRGSRRTCELRHQCGCSLTNPKMDRWRARKDATPPSEALTPANKKNVEAA